MYDFPNCIPCTNVQKMHMRDDTMRTYINWIKHGLADTGKTQTALARHMGIAHPQISALVNGKRNLKVDEIPKIAAFLGIDPPNVEARPVAGELSPVRRAGTVEAGTFREVDEFDQSEPEEINIEPDKRFPNARRMYFEVLGDSMNNLQPTPIFPGAKCICVDFQDVAHETGLRDGMIVVVQRARDGGHVREWSVKQIAMFDDRVEYQPRSTNPRHKPIIVKRDHDADDGVSVEVIALVRRIVNDLPEFD